MQVEPVGAGGARRTAGWAWCRNSQEGCRWRRDAPNCANALLQTPNYLIFQPSSYAILAQILQINPQRTIGQNGVCRRATTDKKVCRRSLIMGFRALSEGADGAETPCINACYRPPSMSFLQPSSFAVSAQYCIWTMDFRRISEGVNGRRELVAVAFWQVLDGIACGFGRRVCAVEDANSVLVP